MSTRTEAAQAQAGGGARWSEFPHLLWRGVVMGIAEVIPGVSGGTVALVTGVLKRFVEAIHSLDIIALKMLFSFRLSSFMARVHWRFFVMLFAGQIAGILLCTRVLSLPHLLRTYPQPMLGLFFGLILGSVVMLVINAGKPGWRGVPFYVVGMSLGALVVAGVRTEFSNSPWAMIITGAVAICAWILPGVSGSFVLLVLRKYDFVWEAITFANGIPIMENLLTILLPLAIGAIVGLAAFARLLSYVFERWPRYTTMLMNGLLIASMWAVFPFQRASYEVVASGKQKMVAVHPVIPSIGDLTSGSGILAIGLAITGAFIVLLLNRLARKAQREAAVSTPNKLSEASIPAAASELE